MVIILYKKAEKWYAVQVCDATFAAYGNDADNIKISNSKTDNLKGKTLIFAA